ncbi:MAG TPA: GNAT family N-acetyltransferase, partial [Actinomycetales bacterium]|nr:GNAT family N-acetyltransferase [Actinomycetales bacterium]
LRDLLDPARPWHDTNGPYFGRPTAEEMDNQAQAYEALAEADPADFPSPREHPLPIVENATGLVVGTVSWYWEDERTDWRRLGVVILDEDAWGKGYATEALGRFTSYVFDSTDTLRLDLATYSENAGMLAVAKRLGFVEEARMRKARRWSGGVHDAVVYGVLREEWAAACERHGLVWE